MKSNINIALTTLKAGCTIGAALFMLSSCAPDKDDLPITPTTADKVSEEAKEAEEAAEAEQTAKAEESAKHLEGASVCEEESGECEHEDSGSVGSLNKQTIVDPLERSRIQSYNSSLDAVFVFAEGTKIIDVQINGNVLVKNSQELARNFVYQIGKFGQSETENRHSRSMSAESMATIGDDSADLNGKTYFYLASYESSGGENVFVFTVEYKGATQTIKKSDKIGSGGQNFPAGRFPEIGRFPIPGFGGFPSSSEN